MRLLGVFLAGLVGIQAQEFPLPEKGVDYVQRGGLMVSQTDPTHVMMGYAIWWAPGDPYADWLVHYSRSHTDIKRAKTIAALAGNVDPRRVPELTDTKIVAAPSLPPEIKATTGLEHGYWSNNASVIRYHDALIREIGADIIVPDMTNATFLDFSYQARLDRYPRTLPQVLKLMASTLDTVPEAARLAPALGVQELDTLNKDVRDGWSPFQRGVLYILSVLQQHPKRAVCYGDSFSPLIMVYHAQNDDYATTTAQQAQELIDLGYRFTLRHVYGFTESMAGKNGNSVWAGTPTDPRPVAPYIKLRDKAWTWCDRLFSPSTDAFSSYTNVPGGSRAEFVCVTPKSTSDLSRAESIPTRGGLTLNAQLSLAARVKPVFLFLSQFNHFLAHADDSGYDIETTRDIEPTEQWGRYIFDMVKTGVANYRAVVANAAPARFQDVRARGPVYTDDKKMIFGMGLKGTASVRVYAFASGPSLAPGFGTDGNFMVSQNPSLEMYRGSTLMYKNEDWALADWSLTTSRCGTMDLRDVRIVPNSAYMTFHMNKNRPVNTHEAAITADLTPNGAEYTFLIDDPQTPGRIGHVRVITSDDISSSKLAGISLRGYASPATSGHHILILNFTLSAPMTIALRGSGPSMNDFGLTGLADPMIKVWRYDNPEETMASLVYASHSLVGSDRTAMAAQFPEFPNTYEKECGAAQLTLFAGSYSVQLSSDDGGSGIGHISVREWVNR